MLERNADLPADALAQFAGELLQVHAMFEEFHRFLWGKGLVRCLSGCWTRFQPPQKKLRVTFSLKQLTQ